MSSRIWSVCSLEVLELAVRIYELNHVVHSDQRGGQEGVSDGRGGASQDGHHAMQRCAADGVRVVQTSGSIVRIVLDGCQGGGFTINTNQEHLAGAAGILDRGLGTQAHGVILAENGIDLRVGSQQVFHQVNAAIRTPTSEIGGYHNGDARIGGEDTVAAVAAVEADRVIRWSAAQFHDHALSIEAISNVLAVLDTDGEIVRPNIGCVSIGSALSEEPVNQDGGNLRCFECVQGSRCLLKPGTRDDDAIDSLGNEIFDV